MTKTKSKDEIRNEIDELKQQLNEVEGTQTEIYARIVGYYRSVKNWNKGKKEEYKYRKQFDNFSETQPEIIVSTDEKKQEFKPELSGNTEYLYFFRTRCPNCPPVKKVVDSIDMTGKEINVDTEEGLELAQKYSVMASPTVIFFDESGNEYYRSGAVKEINEFLKEIC